MFPSVIKLTTVICVIRLIRVSRVIRIITVIRLIRDILLSIVYYSFFIVLSGKCHSVTVPLSVAHFRGFSRFALVQVCSGY